MLGLDNEAILQIELDGNDFLVLSMTGFEHLGQMFEFTIELAGSVPLLPGVPESIDLHKLVGKRASIVMKIDDQERHFDGFVTRAKRLEMRGQYRLYKIVIRPWLWFATQRRNSRVFQKKTVKDIVTEVLAEYKEPTKWDVIPVPPYYPELEICVQYQETDFDFVSRLLEEFGIYYYFEHADKKHTMVFNAGLMGLPALHLPFTTNPVISYTNVLQSTASITRWHMEEESRPRKTVLSAYDYLQPKTVEKDKDGSSSAAEGLGEMEWFEHPARIVQDGIDVPTIPISLPGLDMIMPIVRQGEHAGLSKYWTGLTNALDFATGGVFVLLGHPNVLENQAYLVVSTIYRLDFADPVGIDDLRTTRRHEGFRCDFICQSSIPPAPPFQSARVTKRPVIAGPQTAIVTGSDEVLTDKLGRIKIKFHWDRKGPSDEKSSCWVRVAMPWASKGFGMFVLPRVGDEVVVQFMDGDPDRPIVTGSVYNKDNIPPWAMPDEALSGGFASRERTVDPLEPSTGNEYRFNDKKGSEYVWFQAEKDFYRIVRNDIYAWVQNNETIKVDKTRMESIGENWFTHVTEDVMHHVGKDLHINADGDIFFTGGATWQLKFTKDVQLKAQKVVIEAQAGITFKCGGSVIDMTPAMVKINSGGSGAQVAEAKKESSLDPMQATLYEEQFKDPMDPMPPPLPI